MDNLDDNIVDVSIELDSYSAEIVGTTESITISTGKNETSASSQLDEIMNNGFVANAVTVNNLEEKSDDDEGLDDEYFKQFEWMDDGARNILDDPNDIIVDMHSVPQEERLNLFLDCCKLIESQNLAIMNETEYEDEEDLESAPLYMYYVSLENNKMLLHVDFKKEVDVVLANCAKLYEYARANPPIKVVYTTEVKDLYDVDKDVKLFMNMFGIENTRGGSYTDVELPDFLMMTILHEKKITDVHFYINRKI
jgi:hypothetical protein